MELNQQARDVHFIQSGTVQAPVPGAVFQTFGIEQGLPTGVIPAGVEDTSNQDGEMKRRVLFLSAVIAVYVVINALVQYAFDAAAIENALEQIRAVTNFKGGPTLAMLLMQSIPGVSWSIAIGLLVPFCGWFGARQNNQQLMGCFAGCNFCHCCCGMISLAAMIIFLMMLSAALPGMNDYLDMCDPMQCSRGLEQYPKQEKQERVIDCLAAGMWEDYTQKFAGNHQYPGICPKIVLKCSNFAPLDSDESNTWFEEEPVSSDAAVPGVSGGFSGYATPGIELQPPRTWTEDDDFLAPPRTGLRRLTVSRQAVPVEPAHKGWRTLPMWEGGAEKQSYFPMPSDPIDDCTPEEKGMKIIHQARILLPELAPKLMIFISIKLLLHVPVILLGCLGFWWGKDLFRRYGEGYGRLGAAPAYQPQPRVILQTPIMGSIPLPQAYATPVAAAASVPEASAPLTQSELQENESRDAQE